MTRIDAFEGDYRYLSNFYPCPVTVFFTDTGEIVTFRSSEAAFQAAKCPEVASSFRSLEPAAAKKLGNKVELRCDWNDIRDEIMRKVIRAKFEQNPDLARRLLETKDAELIEGNSWGDTYWGVCDGHGQNKLGRILMSIREELRMNS